MDYISMSTDSGFQFSAIPITDDLDSVQYMLGAVCCDASGSMGGHERNIEKLLKEVVLMCQKLPTRDNILFRADQFNSSNPTVRELHATEKVTNISTDKFNNTFRVFGATPLLDAILFEIEAAREFGREMRKKDYDCSAVIFIGTDGGENASVRATAEKIKNTIEDIRKNELDLISITVILVAFGMQVSDFDSLKADTGIDSVISVNDISPSSLGKVAGLISKSFSTASQQIGSKNTSNITSISI